MRKKIISVLLIALLLLSSMVFAACSKKTEESTDTIDVSEDVDLSEGDEDVDMDELMEEEEEEDDFVPDDPDDPAYANEADGVELVPASHPQEDFYGSWSARSELAHHLFGNADFTINKDGKWEGNVVDEDFQGSWTYEDGAVLIKSDDNVINYKLFFVEDGTLMFQDTVNPDMIALVLKKQ